MQSRLGKTGSLMNSMKKSESKRKCFTPNYQRVNGLRRSEGDHGREGACANDSCTSGSTMVSQCQRPDDGSACTEQCCPPGCPEGQGRDTRCQTRMRSWDLWMLHCDDRWRTKTVLSYLGGPSTRGGYHHRRGPFRRGPSCAHSNMLCDTRRLSMWFLHTGLPRDLTGTSQ